MSEACQARDASHVRLQKLGRGLRVHLSLGELRRFPLLFNGRIGWCRHFRA